MCAVENQLSRNSQQISHNPFWAVASELSPGQCSVVKIGEKIVGQVGQKDVTFLTQETVLAPGFHAQTVLVISELLNFSAAAIIIKMKKAAFGWQGQRGNIVAVQVFTVLEPSFDKDAYGASIVDGWLYLAQPTVLLERIPATYLGSQRFGPAIGDTFRHHVVALCQQPMQLIIGSRPAIQTPNRSFALLWG